MLLSMHIRVTPENSKQIREKNEKLQRDLHIDGGKNWPCKNDERSKTLQSSRITYTIEIV